MKKFIAVIMILVLCISISACASDVTPEKVPNNATEDSKVTDSENTNTGNGSESKVYAIGDTVKADEIEYTLNGVREDKGNEIVKPDEGNIYYLADVTVENKGKESFSVSSLMMFKLMDSEGYSYSVTFGPETKGQLDGEVTAGRKLRGELAFEIPKAAKGLELEIDHNIFGKGKIIYKLDR